MSIRKRPVPKAKQAAIAKAFDNPNVSKVVIYDQD